MLSFLAHNLQEARFVMVHRRSYINKASWTKPCVVASIVHMFTHCNQASYVPNVLDCLYGPALKSCGEAVGTAPISLRVSTRMRRMARVGPNSHDRGGAGDVRIRSVDPSRSGDSGSCTIGIVSGVDY